MDIDIDKLSAKRESMINSLIDHYYSMGTAITFDKITKEYEK